MKKRILAVCITAMLVLLSGCGGNNSAEPDASAPSAGNGMPTVVNTAEYTLYQNIFFNDAKADFDGKETVKTGTFGTVHDAFNDVTRYYVWGYNDQTKCCDWQWELKIDNTSELPSNGSLVKVSGVYEENKDALDDFWIIDPQITVQKPFTPRNVDIDMQAMDDTLERVQAINIKEKKEAFEGQTVCCYGRIQNEKTLKDPYYDNSWTIDISGDYELPAFGTLVLVSGTVRNGVIADCTVTPNTQY